MNHGGDQETKCHDKRTEETERKRNQVLIRKKARGSNKEEDEKKKTNKIYHLAIMNYENRLLVEKRFIVAVNEEKKM